METTGEQTLPSRYFDLEFDPGEKPRVLCLFQHKKNVRGKIAWKYRPHNEGSAERTVSSGRGRYG